MVHIHLSWCSMCASMYIWWIAVIVICNQRRRLQNKFQLSSELGKRQDAFAFWIPSRFHNTTKSSCSERKSLLNKVRSIFSSCRIVHLFSLGCAQTEAGLFVDCILFINLWFCFQFTFLNNMTMYLCSLRIMSNNCNAKFYGKNSINKETSSQSKASVAYLQMQSCQLLMTRIHIADTHVCLEYRGFVHPCHTSILRLVVICMRKFTKYKKFLVFVIWEN